MKEKILELIHKELENIGGVNIFHDSYTPGNFFNYGPIREGRFCVKRNCDVVEYIRPDILDFTLKFEDGEPSIVIYTTHSFTSTETLYKTKYFGLRKFLETNSEYTFKTIVTCGHISFDLSNEENDELIELTKKSYSKYLSLKNENEDKRVLDKLNKRLKKYEK